MTGNMKVRSSSLNFTARILCTLGIALVSVTNAKITVFSVYDVLVELDTLGQMTIARTNVSDFSSQRPKQNTEVFLRVKEARLLNSDGLEVKSYRLDDSEISHFDMTDFESNEYFGLSANGKSMRIGSLGDAQEVLELQFYIFTESGVIQSEVAPQKVSLGDVRVDIVLRNFADVCQSCSNVAALELDLDVRGKPDEEVKTKLSEGKKTNTDIITVSKGAIVVLSNQVSLDGVWKTMPGGYPFLEAMEKSIKVTLRFPSDTNEAIFGITVQPMKIGQNENDVNAPLPSIGKDSSEAAEVRHAERKILLLVVAFVFLVLI